MGRTRIRYRYANERMVLNHRNGSSSPPLAIPSYHTKVIRRGATLPHKLITPSQMALLVCGLTAAPCPYLYEHRQSCPGVTQAVLYEPCFLHPTRRWSRLAGNIQVLVLPFSTPNPRLCGPTHLRPAHQLPDSLAWSRRHRQRIRNLRVEGRCDHTSLV